MTFYVPIYAIFDSFRLREQGVLNVFALPLAAYCS
jgi:hypothetical protein